MPKSHPSEININALDLLAPDIGKPGIVLPSVADFLKLSEAQQIKLVGKKFLKEFQTAFKEYHEANEGMKNFTGEDDILDQCESLAGVLGGTSKNELTLRQLYIRVKGRLRHEKRKGGGRPLDPETQKLQQYCFEERTLKKRKLIIVCREAQNKFNRPNLEPSHVSQLASRHEARLKKH